VKLGSGRGAGGSIETSTGFGGRLDAAVADGARAESGALGGSGGTSCDWLASVSVLAGVAAQPMTMVLAAKSAAAYSRRSSGVPTDAMVAPLRSPKESHAPGMSPLGEREATDGIAELLRGRARYAGVGTQRRGVAVDLDDDSTCRAIARGDVDDLVEESRWSSTLRAHDAPVGKVDDEEPPRRAGEEREHTEDDEHAGEESGAHRVHRDLALVETPHQRIEML
jgi:hypothetical protein